MSGTSDYRVAMYLENYILKISKTDSIERKNLNETSEVIILKIEISRE